MLIAIQKISIKISEEKDSCSLEIFSNTLFKQLLLKSVRSMSRCLYLTPTIIFDFFGLTSSTEVDYILFFYRYLGHYDICMIDKIKSVLFTRSKTPARLNIYFQEYFIKQYNCVEYLGCFLDYNLNEEAMTRKVLNKTNGKLKFLYKQATFVNPTCKKLLCTDSTPL